MSEDTFFGLAIPFIQLIGAQAEHLERGRALARLSLRKELQNSWGYAHGGLVMTLLDVTMSCAAKSTDPEAAAVMTVGMTTNFLRSGAGELVVEGRVLHQGNSLVFCEGEVRDGEAQMVAKATGTFRLRRHRDKG